MPARGEVVVEGAVECEHSVCIANEGSDVGYCSRRCDADLQCEAGKCRALVPGSAFRHCWYP